MSDSNAVSKSTRPWHLWLVGVFALLWSSGGAFDFVMTQTKNPEYMSAFTGPQLEFFYEIPLWAIATWGIAVWGGVIGAILLLMRHQLCRWVFLLSLICMVLTSFQNYVLSNGMEIMGDPFSLGFNTAIFLFALAFYLYSSRLFKTEATT